VCFFLSLPTLWSLKRLLSIYFLWFYRYLLDLCPFFSFIILYTVGRTPWTGDQSVAWRLPTHRTTQTQNKRTQTSMPWVGFEPTIPAFKRAKTIHALDCVATVIGLKKNTSLWKHLRMELIKLKLNVGTRNFLLFSQFLNVRINVISRVKRKQQFKWLKIKYNCWAFSNKLRESSPLGLQLLVAYSESHLGPLFEERYEYTRISPRGAKNDCKSLSAEQPLGTAGCFHCRFQILALKIISHFPIHLAFDMKSVPNASAICQWTSTNKLSHNKTAEKHMLHLLNMQITEYKWTHVAHDCTIQFEIKYCRIF
jgi:hypothetical protein